MGENYGQYTASAIPPTKVVLVLKISYWTALQIPSPPGSTLIMFIKPPVTLYFFYVFIFDCLVVMLVTQARW